MKYLTKNWLSQIERLSRGTPNERDTRLINDVPFENLAVLEEFAKKAIEQTESAQQKLSEFIDLELFYGCHLLFARNEKDGYSIAFSNGKKIIVDFATEKENELSGDCVGFSLSAAELFYEKNIFELHTVFARKEKENNKYACLTVAGSSLKVV